MKIEITRVQMGYNRVLYRKGIDKYPKNCIECGQIFKLTDSSNNIDNRELIFHGNVTDSKSKLLWEFEIIVEFKVDKTLSAEIEQKEIDEFIKTAYGRAKIEFNNAIAKDALLFMYDLCPVENSGVSSDIF